MQILLGIIDSIRRGLGWASGTVSALHYKAAIYSNLTNGKYFLHGTAVNNAATTAYYYSNDGITWSTGSYGGGLTVYGAAASSTRLVVYASSNILQYTDNGTTWTTGIVASSPSGTGNTAKYVNGLFMSMWSGSSTPLYTSPDGVTYTNRTAASNGSGGPWDIAFDGTKYIAVHRSVNARSLTTAWSGTSVTLPINGQAIEYGNGMWVVMKTNDTAYATSPDGTTWTARTLPAATGLSLYSGTALRLGFFNEKFYYVASSATNQQSVYSSPDGIVWTLENSSTIADFNNATGFANGPDRLLIVGAASSTTTSSGYLRGLK